MANIKQEDLVEKTDSTSEEAQVEETTVETTEQDPLKVELERVQGKAKYTQEEKTTYKLRQEAKRAQEMGLDPAEVLGFAKNEDYSADEDDDKPVTVGMLKKIQQESASKNALQLAEDIEDESERELTKFHLQNSIKSTGNPSEDLKLARTLTNAAKNSKILEEVTRKPIAKSHSNASGVDAIDNEVKGELTPQEMLFTKKPLNMTKEEIIKLRPKK